MMAFHPRKLLLQVQICIGYPCAPVPRYPSFSPPPPPPTPNPLFNQTNQNNNNLSGIVIFMLCALSAALFLLLLGYLIFVKKYNSQRRSDESTFDDEHFVDENHGLELDHPIIWYINSSSVGLQQSVIDSIAVFKYKRGDEMIEGTDCSVCLNEFQEDDTLRLLPKCNHAFHIPCIDTWLSSNETCPLCRAPIVNSSPLNSVESNSNDLEENLENCGEVGSTQVGDVETNEISIGEETNIESRAKVEEEETGRRSVSMDLAYASRMCHAVANNIPRVELEGCSSTRLVELKKPNSEVVAKRLNKNSSIYRLMRSSSFGRYLQKRPIAMKRSFSSSGKEFSSPRRFSRSQDTILPLR